MQALAREEFARHLEDNQTMGANTVIGVVATNAKLTKEEVNKLAQMAQDGIAMTVRPAHTMFDGDTILGSQRVWYLQISTSLEHTPQK